MKMILSKLARSLIEFASSTSGSHIGQLYVSETHVVVTDGRVAAVVEHVPTTGRWFTVSKEALDAFTGFGDVEVEVTYREDDTDFKDIKLSSDELGPLFVVTESVRRHITYPDVMAVFPADDAPYGSFYLNAERLKRITDWAIHYFGDDARLHVRFNSPDKPIVIEVNGAFGRPEDARIILMPATPLNGRPWGRDIIAELTKKLADAEAREKDLVARIKEIRRSVAELGAKITDPANIASQTVNHIDDLNHGDVAFVTYR